ncbi:MAG: hypothetical protein QXL31_05940 [Thermosphaera sp.]
MAFFIVIALIAGLVGFMVGSISAAVNTAGGAAKIVVTVTSTTTVMKSTVITTTLTTATPTTVTETATYVRTVTKTTPPRIFEVPAAEWLTEDGRLRVRADVVVEDGRFSYVRVKVTNVGNETLRDVMVIFVPYANERPLFSPSNIVILKDVGAGETHACRFAVSRPDTPFKLLVLAL